MDDSLVVRNLVKHSNTNSETPYTQYFPGFNNHNKPTSFSPLVWRIACETRPVWLSKTSSLTKIVTLQNWNLKLNVVQVTIAWPSSLDGKKTGTKWCSARSMAKIIHKILNKTSTLNIEMSWIYNKKEITTQTGNLGHSSGILEVDRDACRVYWKMVAKPILDVSPRYERNRYLS